MDKIKKPLLFFSTDSRLLHAHISLYTAMLSVWEQSRCNKNEQRLELGELEEVVQRTVNKVQELENRKTELPDILIPDYTSQLEVIKRELIRVNHSYPVEKISDQIKLIEKLSNGVPEIGHPN